MVNHATAEERLKEWAYAGFAITYISATVSGIALDGVNALTFLPIIVFGVLIISYLSYHKIYLRQKKK